MRTIFTIIVIAAAIVLGSKVIKGIFNLIKSAIKIVAGIAIPAGLFVLFTLGAAVNNKEVGDGIKSLKAISEDANASKEFVSLVGEQTKKAIEYGIKYDSEHLLPSLIGASGDEVKEYVKELKDYHGAQADSLSHSER